MQVKTIITPSDADILLWKEFINTDSHTNFFQSDKALSFFKRLKNYNPVLILAAKENNIIGSLLGVVIKSPGIKGRLSSRCIVWGGPVTNDNEAAEKLIISLEKIVSAKSIYVEYRNMRDVSNINPVFQNLGYKFSEHLNYIIPVKDLQYNKSILSSTRKRQINKALKSGAVIKEASSSDDVAAFYLILSELYKKKVKKPLPGINFFTEFFKDSSLGKIFLISYQNNIIGGIVCPIYKGTIYEYYVCGLDSEYKYQYPSVLATWAPIEYAANNGLKYFDFMGAGKPDADYGVREFKSKFGGELVNYGRYLKVTKPALYSIGKTGLNLLQKLK